MKTKNRKKGDLAEDIVHNYYEKLGFKILARNYYIHNLGEIDIIAEKGNQISFIEVKTRSKLTGYNLENYCMSSEKIKKIKRCISVFLQRNHIIDADINLIGAFVHPSLDQSVHKIDTFLLV